MELSHAAKRSRFSGPSYSTHSTGSSFSTDNRPAERISTQQEYQRNVESQPFEEIGPFLAGVPILKRDEDYYGWIRNIKDRLMVAGYGPFLKKRKPRPSDEDIEALLDFLDEHEIAIAAVLSRISPERRLRLQECDQVDLLLEDIENKFKPTGNGFLMKRSEELFSLTRDQCESVSHYSSQPSETRYEYQMSGRDIHISDAVLVHLFLHGLGPFFDNFKMNFLNKFDPSAVDTDGAPVVTLQTVTRAAEDYERLMKMHSPKQATSK